VILAALAILIAATVQEGTYSWHTALPGESVQYGLPETDDRALRIDCRRGAGLQILGPSGIQISENMPTQVTFRRGTDRIVLLGVTVSMGDGLNFAVPVAPEELPIAALLAGEPITIEHGDTIWEIPGAGAPAVLAPLAAACSR
jgi:hypothetical protein